MRVSLLVILFFIVSGSLSAQSAPKWGQPFIVRNNTSYPDLLTSDNSGLYFSQKKTAIKTFYGIGHTTRKSANLLKMDKNLQETYLQNYNDQLKGKEFEMFFSLKDQLYIIGSIASKSALSLYAAEINKKNGQFINDWVLITSFNKSHKNEEIALSITPNADSSAMIIIGKPKTWVKSEFFVSEVKKDLKPVTNIATIDIGIKPALYEQEELLYTTANRIILAGKVFTYVEGKKQNNKNREFSHYSLQMFDESGKLIKEIKSSVEGKWLSNPKVFQVDNKLFLTAFFSNSPKTKVIDGLMVQTIDPLSFEVLNTIEENISADLLDASIDKQIPENETSQQRKEREDFEKSKKDGEGVPIETKFRKLHLTESGEIIVIAERYSKKTYMVTRTVGSGVNSSMQTYINVLHETGNFIFCKIDPVKSSIDWVKIVPKKQTEINTDAFSGFTSFQKGNLLNIIFNDNPKNEKVVQPTQKIAGTNLFANTDCFMLTLDMNTGSISRKKLFNNSNQPVIQPQTAVQMNETFFIIGIRYRAMARTEISVGKLNIK